MREAPAGREGDTCVASTGTGNTAGRDVTTVGPLTIQNNLGHGGPDLSVKAAHYDQKVAENARLQQEVLQLREDLEGQRTQSREEARRFSSHIADQDRAHSEAVERLRKQAQAARRAAVTEVDELRSRLFALQHEVDNPAEPPGPGRTM